MGVLGALLRDLSLEHDPLGLLHRELGPLDEVREIGLEEGEGAQLVCRVRLQVGRAMVRSRCWSCSNLTRRCVIGNPLRRLRSAIARRQRPGGSWKHELNATAYALIALHGGRHHAVERKVGHGYGRRSATSRRGHPRRGSLGAASRLAGTARPRLSALGPGVQRRHRGPTGGGPERPVHCPRRRRPERRGPRPTQLCAATWASPRSTTCAPASDQADRSPIDRASGQTPVWTTAQALIALSMLS